MLPTARTPPGQSLRPLLSRTAKPYKKYESVIDVAVDIPNPSCQSYVGRKSQMLVRNICLNVKSNYLICRYCGICRGNPLKINISHSMTLDNPSFKIMGTNIDVNKWHLCNVLVLPLLVEAQNFFIRNIEMKLHISPTSLVSNARCLMQTQCELGFVLG